MPNQVGLNSYPPEFVKFIQKDHNVLSSSSAAVQIDYPQDAFESPKKKQGFLGKALLTLAVLAGAGYGLAKFAPKIKVADDATGIVAKCKKYLKQAGEWTVKQFDAISKKSKDTYANIKIKFSKTEKAAGDAAEKVAEEAPEVK